MVALISVDKQRVAPTFYSKYEHEHRRLLRFYSKDEYRELLQLHSNDEQRGLLLFYREDEQRGLLRFHTEDETEGFPISTKRGPECVQSRNNRIARLSSGSRN
jgi:hypothetical protein